MSRFSTDKGWGVNEGITVIFAKSGGARYSIGGRDDPTEAEAIAAHFNDVLENGLGAWTVRAGMSPTSGRTIPAMTPRAMPVG